MSLVAALAGGTGHSQAWLQELDGNLEPKGARIHFRFNPTQYQIQKSNSFAEIAIPGLDVPPLQFIRGGGEKLAFELLLDTAERNEDVREEYVDAIRKLMAVAGALHAPPVVEFGWDGRTFQGVIDSLSVTYLLFNDKGVPVRAKAALSLKQYVPVDRQIKEQNNTSPDVEKAYVVQAGDTLSSIAAQAYGDPARWRELAVENGIRDPRSLRVGRELRIPRIALGGT